MTIYIIILLLCLLGIIFSKRQENNKYAYLIVTLMLIIGACRDISVGSDTYGVYPYNFYYTNFNPKSWNAGTPFEPGFNYLIAFFKHYVSKSYTLFYCLLFLYTFSITIWFLFKKSNNKSIIVFIFYSLGYFFFCMNGMRQSFAFATALLPLYFFLLKKKKLLLYGICIILISFFLHKSTAIFILIPIIEIFSKKYKFGKKFLAACIIGSYIFAFVFQDKLFNYLPLLSSFVDERYAMYMNTIQENNGITPLFKSAMCLLVIYNSRNTKDLFLLIFVVGTIIYNILISFSPTASRAAIHFLILGCIPIAEVWTSPQEGNKQIVRLGLFIYCIIYIIYFYFIKNYDGIIPYSISRSL